VPKNFNKIVKLMEEMDAIPLPVDGVYKIKTIDKVKIRSLIGNGHPLWRTVEFEIFFDFRVKKTLIVYAWADYRRLKGLSADPTVKKISEKTKDWGFEVLID